MEWTDEGIVTGVRRHGEGNAIVELMTMARGRHQGLVRGGQSRLKAPILQPGNKLLVTWRARLDEHLGNLAVEPLKLRAEALMRHPHGAYGLSHIASLIHLLAEREPHPGLFGILDAILDAFEAPTDAAILLARFEVAMLAELGFGLELDVCAATGARDDLVYVSPKSGRAVSAAAGAPFSDRLLPLPTFLLASQVSPSLGEVEDAFRLTGYFLNRRIMEPRGLALSDARAAFISAVRRQDQ